jgi:hypothetical protein
MLYSLGEHGRRVLERWDAEAKGKRGAPDD